MKIIYILITILCIVSCVSAVNFEYTTISGKVSNTYNVAEVNGYLTLDEINVTLMNEMEGYILALPICVTGNGYIYQFAVIYGDSFGLKAYTFRNTDKRGISGYFKPGDKVKLDMSGDWSIEKIV